MKLQSPISLLCLFLLLHLVSFAEEIKLTGVYQGKNIYVQNPLKTDQSGYCTQAVFVNGTKVLDNPRASSYEINLSKYPINTPVEIRIVHSNGCKPKVINKYVIDVRTNFKFISVNVDDKNINWTVEGETNNSVYYVEQLVNNNWTNLKVLTVQTQQKNKFLQRAC
jgi:hypothetical protein